MKKSIRILSFTMAIVILFASCSSSTMIISNPPNAKLYIDGEMVGQTPYKHLDSKIVGSSIEIRIVKDGYEPFLDNITKNEEADVGAIIGGLFIWVPFLWAMKYKPSHSYELKNIALENETLSSNTKSISTPYSKASKLRELKQLLDDKIISAEEFEKEKTKILDAKE